MTREEILKRVKSVISKEFSISEDVIHEDSMLKMDLGLDSLSLIQLSISIEDEFCDIDIISIDENDMINDISVGKLVSLIEQELLN